MPPVQMAYGQVEPSPPVAHLKKRLKTNNYESNDNFQSKINNDESNDNFQSEAVMTQWQL